jgi:hypothetical protein
MGGILHVSGWVRVQYSSIAGKKRDGMGAGFRRFLQCQNMTSNSLFFWSLLLIYGDAGRAACGAPGKA